MRHSNIRWLAFVPILVFCTLVSAGGIDLAASIDALLADPALKYGIQGVVVESLSTGEVLYERNRNIAFVPASNFKLIVSAAALDCFGPDHRFYTSIYITAEVDSSGTLDGDVVIVGGGNPVLSTTDLKSIVEDIKNLGIKRITGNIVADSSLFDDLPLGQGWSWDYEPYYYAAQISALNLDRNVVKVQVRPGVKPGDPAYVSLNPSSGFMTVKTTAVTGATGSENTLYIDRERGKNKIRVSGSIPMDYNGVFVEPITMENPALYTATMFRELLSQSGIKVDGTATCGLKPDNAQLIVKHQSPPLSDILPLLNKPSDNLIAEVLFKSLGARFKGRGAAANAEKVELDFLSKIGADTKAIAINDGSGLSRLNYVTPGNLIVLLRFMWNHEHSKVYIKSLPVAGVEGTLRSRMKGTAAEGNVRAKTGYVSRASCLSGYVTTSDGVPLVFSIMMNGHMCPNSEAKRVQDSICALLAGLKLSSDKQ